MPTFRAIFLKTIVERRSIIGVHYEEATHLAHGPISFFIENQQITFFYFYTHWPGRHSFMTELIQADLKANTVCGKTLITQSLPDLPISND